MAEVLDAGQRFAERTGRRVSLEYVMIDGVNDSPEEAGASLVWPGGWLCHVNLIPLNPTPALAAGAGRRVRESIASRTSCATPA